jgi:box C/D snoRNA protein 1
MSEPWAGAGSGFEEAGISVTFDDAVEDHPHSFPSSAQNSGEVPPAGKAEEEAVPPREERATECEMCRETEARYACPGCGIRTCSVPCVRKHKVDTSCTGQAAPFVRGLRLEKFSDSDLREDYRFLERGRLLRKPAVALDLDIKPAPRQRRNNNNKRSLPSSDQSEPPAKVPRLDGAGAETDAQLELEEEEEESKPEAELPPPTGPQSPRTKVLVREAKNRDITLLSMPPQLSRHQENTTSYNRRRKRLNWRTEWVFVNGQTRSCCCQTGVRDDLPLATLLAQVMKSPDFLELPAAARRDLEQPGARIFMKACNTPANAPEYAEFDGGATLGDSLKGRTLIEFPTLTVLSAEVATGELSSSAIHSVVTKASDA